MSVTTEGFAFAYMSNLTMNIVCKYLRNIVQLQPASVCFFLTWIVYLLQHFSFWSGTLIFCWRTSTANFDSTCWISPMSSIVNPSTGDMRNTPNQLVRMTLNPMLEPSGWLLTWCIPALSPELNQRNHIKFILILNA